MRMRDIKRWLSGLLCVAMLCQTAALPAFASAAVEQALADGTAQTEQELDAENGWSLDQLQAQFPDGRYWNHADNPGTNNNDVMHTSSTPCPWHNDKGYNPNTCNHYSSGRYGCWGYADQLGYLYSGSDPERWTKLEGSQAQAQVDVLDVGDIVRFKFDSGAEHSMFVTKVTSDRVYYTDCNVGSRCIIAWNRTQTKEYFRSHIMWVRLLPGHNPKPEPGPEPDPDRDELGCTTAYAGWYQVTGRDGANVNSRHSKNWGDQVGELAKGEYVYVSKATGTGSGNLGHIMYNGVERYIAMGLFKRMSGSPIGSVDSYGADAGSVWVNGWAFDWDNCESQLTIEVCLDNNVVLRGTANTERSDVNSSYSSVVGSYHGFSLRAGTNLTGSHKMDIYAVNVGSGENKCIGSVWVNIPSSDQEAPVISNVKVSNITTEGYDVSCTVTDNVGVDRVMFPTWTTANRIDDLLSDWSTNPKARGTRNGDTWTFHVDIAEHNNEHGEYLTHINAYDAAGNQSGILCDAIVVPEPYPTITFDTCGGKAEFTEKQLERNADGMHYGALPEAWMDGYVFEGWYTETAGGTRVSRSTAYTAKGNTTLYAQWTPVAADAEKGWSLQDGTLIITAQGAMQDYGSAAQTPWFKDRGDIRRIVVQKGVTTIGDYAFYGCKNVTSVTLPDTVTQIGKLAFYGCENLSTLTVPDSVLVVEDYAFANAAGLKSIVFRGNAPVMGAGIFAGLNLEVRYPTAAAGWTDGVKQSYTGSVRWSGVGASALAAQESDLQLDDPVLAALLADSCV